MERDIAQLPVTGARRHRRFIGIAVGVVGLGFLTVLATAWFLAARREPDAFQQCQRACMEYTLPPDTVVYEQDPDAAARLLERPDQYRPLRHYLHLDRPCAVRYAPCWFELNAAIGVATSPLYKPGFGKDEGSLEVGTGTEQDRRTPLVFLHERQTPAGERWIVAVHVTEVGRTDGLHLECSTRKVMRRSPGKHGIVDELLGPDGPVCGTWDDDGVGRQLESGNKVRRLRLFAGQSDPLDPTRFTIGYEMNGERGTIEGRLTDGRRTYGEVKLRIVDGPAAR